MVVGVCKQQQQSINKNGRFFYAVTIKYLCQSCGKHKNVTFFLLDVFLYPNALHELTIL